MNLKNICFYYLKNKNLRKNYFNYQIHFIHTGKKSTLNNFTIIICLKLSYLLKIWNIISIEKNIKKH